VEANVIFKVSNINFADRGLGHDTLDIARRNVLTTGLSCINKKGISRLVGWWGVISSVKLLIGSVIMDNIMHIGKQEIICRNLMEISLTIK
jgi:hypothetical protein